MKQKLTNRIGIEQCNRIKNLVVYKAKSRGVILAKYDTVDDYVNAEKKFNPDATTAHVYYNIIGKTKYSTSFHLQSKVKIKATIE